MRGEPPSVRHHKEKKADLEGFIKIVFESLIGRLWGGPQLRLRVYQCRTAVERKMDEQHTFFGAALVPLRSLPPEPVYVLCVDACKIWGDRGVHVEGTTPTIHSPRQRHLRIRRRDRRNKPHLFLGQFRQPTA